MLTMCQRRLNLDIFHPECGSELMNWLISSDQVNESHLWLLKQLQRKTSQLLDLN
jgi:hypothetical protein